MLGPNGAGKSTTLKAIFGLLRVSAGHVVFNGQEITNALPDKLVPQGLSFVPQEKNVFTSLTVEENLEVGRQPVRPGAPHWTREKLFALMSRNASSATTFFKIPANRVVELGTRIEL